MEWLLITLLWWKDPAITYTRLATEEECKQVGTLTVKMAEESRNRGSFKCVEVAISKTIIDNSPKFRK